MTEHPRRQHKPDDQDDTSNTRLLDSYCPPQNTLEPLTDTEDRLERRLEFEHHPDSFLALADRIDTLVEMIGEHEAEMGSEIAMFGDAWPGAQPQLREKKEHLNRLLIEWANPLELPALPDVALPPTVNTVIEQLESAFDDCISLLSLNMGIYQERVVAIAQALEASACELGHDLRAHVLAEENFHTPTDEAGEAQRRADLDLLLAGGPQW